MTIEQKALEMVNAVYLERHGTDFQVRLDRSIAYKDEALCRALEAHEADKANHAAEMREQAERFSEAAAKAVEDLECWIASYPDADEVATLNLIAWLKAFIIAQPDPLVEAIRALEDGRAGPTAESKAACLRNAADELGYTLAIVKKEAVNG